MDGNEGGKTIAKSTGVHPSSLHQWIKLFGDDAFEKRYTPYPPQFKLDVLNYMNEHGTSIETAAIFNIPLMKHFESGKLFMKQEDLMPYNQRKRGVHP